MPVYLCRVSDASGKIEQFLRDAASEDSLVRELSDRSLFVLSVKEQQHQEGARTGGKRFPRKLIREFTDLLTIMLASGLSLKDSLEVAETVSSKGPANELVTMLIQRIHKGDSFASALDAAGKSFPSVYRGMVKIGERIGSLEQVFSRLSAYLTDEKKLRERFGAALIYPAIVFGVALLSAVLIVAILFPRLREIFSEIGPGMAGRVESLMGSLTTAFTVIGAVLILVIVLAVLMTRAHRKGGELAVRIDFFLLHVPLVAAFLMQRELLNFSFAMETLTAAGVSVEEALSEGAGAVGNNALKKDIHVMKEKVMKGERLSSAFAHSTLFPESISRWVSVGERVGHVAKVFGQLRTYYQQEVEKWINRLMALIEPAIIVLLGALIILFVVFFIIPIFSLYGNIL